MKERNSSRPTVLAAAIILLALARVTVVPSIGGDTAWVLNHIIQTVGLVCCLLWLREWKKGHKENTDDEKNSDVWL